MQVDYTKDHCFTHTNADIVTKIRFRISKKHVIPEHKYLRRPSAQFNPQEALQGHNLNRTKNKRKRQLELFNRFRPISLCLYQIKFHTKMRAAISETLPRINTHFNRIRKNDLFQKVVFKPSHKD